MSIRDETDMKRPSIVRLKRVYRTGLNEACGTRKPLKRFIFGAVVVTACFYCFSNFGISTSDEEIELLSQKRDESYEIGGVIHDTREIKVGAPLSNNNDDNKLFNQNLIKTENEETILKELENIIYTEKVKKTEKVIEGKYNEKWKNKQETNMKRDSIENSEILYQKNEDSIELHPDNTIPKLLVPDNILPVVQDMVDMKTRNEIREHEMIKTERDQISDKNIVLINKLKANATVPKWDIILEKVDEFEVLKPAVEIFKSLIVSGSDDKKMIAKQNENGVHFKIAPPGQLQVVTEPSKVSPHGPPKVVTEPPKMAPPGPPLVVTEPSEVSPHGPPQVVTEPLKVAPHGPPQEEVAHPESSEVVIKEDSYLVEMLKDYKKILYWNDLFGSEQFSFGFGQLPFLLAKCEYSKCYATNERDLFDFKDIDAVMWHLASKDRTLPPPKLRAPHTIYIFTMMADQNYQADKIRYEKFNNIFNWTYTVRSDSDFRFPFGDMELIPESQKEESIDINYALGRPQKAAWFVSNCVTRSERSELYNTLKQYITIDVYGKCGSFECDKRLHDTCGDMLEQNYKFYLAFEATLCNEYVTEKIFRAFQFNTIPVVYGLGYESFNFPSDSYIDIMDFESIKDLGKYLEYLNSNDTAYSEYFNWKTDYRLMKRFDFHRNNFCEICKRLHEMYPTSVDPQTGKTTITDLSASRSKVYSDIGAWWTKDQCSNPNENKQMARFIRGESKTAISKLNKDNQNGTMDISKRENLISFS